MPSRKLHLVLLVTLSLFFSANIEGAKRIVLKSGENFERLEHKENAIIIINREIDLNGGTFIAPMNSTLKFKKKGLIKNGTLQGNNTTLCGKVKLHCGFAGTFTNEEIPASWLQISDSVLLTKQIASLFNLSKVCSVRMDKDIVLDGSIQRVAYVSIEGKYWIKNSCVFRANGNIRLKDVTFSGFEKYRELFIDLRDISGPVNIDIEDVNFDGNWNISRFIYCPYQDFEYPSNILVYNSYFTRLKNFIVQFRPSCTGRIINNKIYNIGTNEKSNVIGFHLGDSDDEVKRLCAKSFAISNNVFKDFIVPYNNDDDGREAHAVLLYGHDNIVRDNKVINFFSQELGNSCTGCDSEGIYLKGGNNTVINNYLENCIGGPPDGAVTIKSTYGNNRIIGNIIKHKYGLGIQCCSPNSIIEQNTIYSEHEAEAGIAMLSNTGSTVRNNKLSATSGKDYHSAIALVNCDNVSIRGNQFSNTSCIFTTYTCRGQIIFDGNEVDLNGLIYGSNTYYTAPFELHDDTADYIMNNNSFKLKGVRASQLIEAPEKFKGSVILKSNSLHFEDSDEIQSKIIYMVRNVKSLTVEQNVETTKVKRIDKVSNLSN